MFHLFSWKFIKSYLQPMLMHSGVWRLMPQWQLCNKQEGWREQKISSIQCIRKSRAFFRNQKILIHAIWYLLFCFFVFWKVNLFQYNLCILQRSWCFPWISLNFSLRLDLKCLFNQLILSSFSIYKTYDWIIEKSDIP